MLEDTVQRYEYRPKIEVGLGTDLQTEMRLGVPKMTIGTLKFDVDGEDSSIIVVVST